MAFGRVSCPLERFGPSHSFLVGKFPEDITEVDMSRTLRDIQRAHERRWWQKWKDILYSIPGAHFFNQPHDMKVEQPREPHLRGMYSSYYRRLAARKDRHRLKDALRHSDLEGYYRRKGYDDDGY